MISSDYANQDYTRPIEGTIKKSASMPSLRLFNYGQQTEADVALEIYRNSSKRGANAKISRRQFRQLHHSYYITAKGNIYQHIHGKKGESDEKQGLLGVGSSSEVYCLNTCRGHQEVVRIIKIAHQNRIHPQTIKCHEVFRGKPHLLTGEYFAYLSEKENKKVLREMFIVPQCTIDLFEFLKKYDFFYTKHTNVARYIKLNIMCQVAAGLSEMHKKGWHHGDIKSENILIKCDAESSIHFDVYLSDFDYSCEVATAPELNWGSLSNVDPRIYFELITENGLLEADIFSLGVVFSELFLGIYDFTKFSWLSESFLDPKLGENYPERPEKLERSMMEELGFIKEPKDKDSIEHLIWRMCSPVGGERPNIDEVCHRLYTERDSISAF